MKRLFLLCLAGLVAAGTATGVAAQADAQSDALFLSEQQQPVRASVGVVYQEFTVGDVTITETSFPLTLSIPLGRRAGLSFRASGVTASGDGLEPLGGVSDAQAGLSVQQPLGRGSLVVNLGVNLPSGQRELTTDEFRTAILLSQQLYNFRVPGFGQGLNATPGFVLAFPLTETVAAGAGLSYAYKGDYRPLADTETSFDPGDELLVTGGLSVRIGRRAHAAVDMTYTRYGEGTYGPSTFDSGDRLSVTGQFMHVDRVQELRLLGRISSYGESTLPVRTGSAETLQVLPSQVLLRGSGARQVSSLLRLGGLVEVRFLGAIDDGAQSRFVSDLGLDLSASQSIFSLGVLPEFRFNRDTSLRTRLLYTAGDLSGLEAGATFVVSI